MEKFERYKTAQLSREIEIALPVELTREQNISLVRRFVKEQFVSAGMCADVCVHDKDGTNPHAHIMLTMRPIGPNINKNERPFILVGHSQGASLLAECATLMLGNEKYFEYNKNHIATYAVGYSVTQEQISRNSELKFASSPNDTGVILSWNTTSPSEVESEAYKNFGTWNPDALTINPITWTTDETPAPASANLASRMFNILDGTSAVIENYADATVDNTAKVLVCASAPENDYAASMPTIGRYHMLEEAEAMKIE